MFALPVSSARSGQLRPSASIDAHGELSSAAIRCPQRPRAGKAQHVRPARAFVAAELASDPAPAERPASSRGKAALAAALAAAIVGVSATTPVQAAGRMNLATPELATSKADTVLRNALPLNEESEKPMREIQRALEDIRTKMRLPRGKFEAVAQAAQNASKVINANEGKAILGIRGREKQLLAAKLVDDIREDISAIYYAADQKLPASLGPTELRVLDNLSKLEELMVDGWPYKRMPSYAGLPYLKGRAAVRFETAKGDFVVVADGYNAPVTAGNFVDLAQRGFYDGLPFAAFPSQSILTAGRPAKGDGFVDPKSKQLRTVPLEVKVKEFLSPIYGRTLDDAGLLDDEKNVELPFGAYGAVAMTHPEGEANGASSEFMIYLYTGNYFESRLLDGNYAVLGYVVEGRNVLPTLAGGDTIKAATVLSGLENLTST